ncbi:hypothetical protein HYR99_35735 [Candidatus Poribacteria bacterium]|nr:hypothetical protein [Candidatus Poribacteria bacterium]
MNRTQPLPYSDTIRQLNHQKSGFLLRAQELQKNGEVAGEALLLFSKAAEIEMQIAHLLQDAEHENTIIHWVSAASCYMQAKNYQSALEQLDRILTQPIPPRLRRDVEKFRSRCKRHMKIRAINT